MKTDSFKNFSIDKMINFVKENVRYFAAGALFIILVLVLVLVTKPGGNGGTDATEAITETQVVVESYQEDAIPEINELIGKYYNAYAKGKTKALGKYADPISDNEKSFVKMFSEYVEKYENIKCYTKQGLDENSYLVSVYMEIKFKDVETTAPGLDFFYVTKDAEGKYMINNLYSQFNLLNKEQTIDPAIEALINDFEQQDDVMALQADVQSKYEAAVAADANLSNMISTTIAQAYTTWAQSLVPAATETPATEAPATETPATEAPVAETPAAEEPASEAPAPTTETVYVTDNVNIRTQPSQDAEVLEQAALGTAYTRTGTTEDGWSKIDYNGTEAYIKSDYVSTTPPEAPADTAEGTASNDIAEGTSIYLTEAVNIRESMDENSAKVGTAFGGETVTVVMSYAEGWTKINWNDKTGYVKTELLQ